MSTPRKFRKKPVIIEAITFDELVEYGRANGANIVNGMPWSFTYKGQPITHENDQCYLIPTLEGTMKFQPGDMLIPGVKGEIYPCKSDIFAATYEEVTDASELCECGQPRNSIRHSFATASSVDAHEFKPSERKTTRRGEQERCPCSCHQYCGCVCHNSLRDQLAEREAELRTWKSAYAQRAKEAIENAILVGDMREHIHELESREQRLREALQNLVNKLLIVHADPHYQSVWTLAQLHRGSYIGAQYADELKAAQEALNPSPEKEPHD